jgi:hypothetical protein
MSGTVVQRVVATFGTAANGQLGHGFPLTSQLFPRIVASLAGYAIKQVSCGGAHTAVVTGALALPGQCPLARRTRGRVPPAAAHVGCTPQLAQQAAFRAPCRGRLALHVGPQHHRAARAQPTRQVCSRECASLSARFRAPPSRAPPRPRGQPCTPPTLPRHAHDPHTDLACNRRPWRSHCQTPSRPSRREALTRSR